MKYNRRQLLGKGILVVVAIWCLTVNVYPKGKNINWIREKEEIKIQYQRFEKERDRVEKDMAKNDKQKRKADKTGDELERLRVYLALSQKSKHAADLLDAVYQKIENWNRHYNYEWDINHVRNKRDEYRNYQICRENDIPAIKADIYIKLKQFDKDKESYNLAIDKADRSGDLNKRLDIRRKIILKLKKAADYSHKFTTMANEDHDRMRRLREDQYKRERELPAIEYDLLEKELKQVDVDMAINDALLNAADKTNAEERRRVYLNIIQKSKNSADLAEVFMQNVEHWNKVYDSQLDANKILNKRNEYRNYQYYVERKLDTLDHDREEIIVWPYMAEIIANRWYYRGDNDIALEFDKVYVKQDPYYANEIANKWYKRGENDIASEFDKVYAQKYPYRANEIANKWYKRGEKDIALEFDKFYTQQDPYSANAIADKWYERGEKDIASEFDKVYAQKYPYYANQIVDKWYKRKEKNIGLEFNKLYPNSALTTLNELIRSGQFPEAVEYGNKLLGYWVTQSDEDIQKNIDDKLEFAARVEASDYYKILKSKLVDIIKDDITHNYLKFLENLPLNPTLKDVSITDYLTHRAYINPDFLNAYGISIEEARMMLEVDLYELTKKSDITFSILHVIALHAKKDSYFKLHIFYEDPAGKRRHGAYAPSMKRIYINKNPLRSQFLRGVLTHEWTHQLMDVLFKNYSEPYAKDDEAAKSAWDKAMNVIWKRLDEAPKKLKGLSEKNPSIDSYGLTITVYNQIKELYEKNHYDSEAIARFAEIIAMDAYEDPSVKEFLKPIYDYWMQFIEPAIEKYVLDHPATDSFVCDLERENVLDPLYRYDIDSNEYKSDLSIVKGQPLRLYSMGDKWYARGYIDYAVEFDKIRLKKFPQGASIIAGKWKERGYPEIAREFN